MAHAALASAKRRRDAGERTCAAFQRIPDAVGQTSGGVEGSHQQ